MAHSNESSRCQCCSMSRRSFLTGCATCAGAMIIPMTSSLAIGVEPKNKRIRVLYSLHAEVQPKPDWPNIGFDFNPVMERMAAALSAGCPGIEFIPMMANGESQAKAILVLQRKVSSRIHAASVDNFL